MINNFGSFIRAKRVDKSITLRRFSKIIGVSPVYMSNIEQGNRPAPSDEIMLNMLKALVLTEKEKEFFYDLAARSKKPLTLATDLVEYINSESIIHETLRLAKRYNATDDDWQVFNNYLLEKYC